MKPNQEAAVRILIQVYKRKLARKEAKRNEPKPNKDEKENN